MATKNRFKPVIGISIVSLVLCGMIFPFLVTGIAQALFPSQANGEIITLKGHPVGSSLISQQFVLPSFFHGRDENNSTTASASGVDPDISLQDAVSQIPRVSAALNLTDDDVLAVVNRHVEGTYWIFGSPYVDVLQLNIDLINTYPNQYGSILASH